MLCHLFNIPKRIFNAEHDRRIAEMINNTIVHAEATKIVLSLVVKNTTGYHNSAFRTSALYYNTSGKYNIEQRRMTGFLAQEVAEAAEAVDYNFSGVNVPENAKDLYTLSYAEFVVPLVKAVQELADENKELRKRIEALEAK